jgi:uncharacterized protein (DUF1330 family)
MAEPEVPAEAEQLNPVEFQELVERADEGPVVMLNLLDFKPAGGAERYLEYAEAVEPLLERAGATVLFAGQASAALIGPSRWDLVALVQYPTRRAFLDMIGSAEYQAIAHLRGEALERTELHPLDPAADS